MEKIILASASPRRRDLLSLVGIEYDVIVSEADENISETDPESLVKQLSEIKARAVYDSLIKEGSYDGRTILGADTVVAIDGQILGKPKDEQDAFEMLKALSGKKHSVFTGVSLLKDGNQTETFCEETKVEFFELEDQEIWDYIETREPMDKAGAYGIQGYGCKLIKGIEGDYNTVVGLPAAQVYRKLRG